MKKLSQVRDVRLWADRSTEPRRARPTAAATARKALRAAPSRSGAPASPPPRREEASALAASSSRRACASTIGVAVSPPTATGRCERMMVGSAPAERRRRPLAAAQTAERNRRGHPARAVAGDRHHAGLADQLAVGAALERRLISPGATPTSCARFEAGELDHARPTAGGRPRRARSPRRSRRRPEASGPRPRSESAHAGRAQGGAGARLGAAEAEARAKRDRARRALDAATETHERALAEREAREAELEAARAEAAQLGGG